MNYCYRCGHKLEVHQEDAEWYCRSCQQSLWANPVPCADILLIDEEGKILLGRRTREPHIGKLNLPGGFIDMGETIEQAVVRETREELGLSPADYGKLTFGGTRVDYTTSGGGKERQILNTIMVGKIAHKDFEANDEVSELVWVDPSQLKPEDVTTQAEYDHIMAALEVSRS